MNVRRFFLSLVLPVLIALIFSTGFYFYIQSQYFQNLYYSYQTGKLYSGLDDLADMYYENTGGITDDSVNSFQGDTNAVLMVLDIKGNIVKTSDKLGGIDTEVYEDGLDYLETFKSNKRMFESVVIGGEQVEMNLKEVIVGRESVILAKPVLNPDTGKIEAILFCIAPIAIISITIDFIRSQMGMFFAISIACIAIISIIQYKRVTKAMGKVSMQVEENWELTESPAVFKRGSYIDLRKQTEELINKIVSENTKLKEVLKEKELSEKEKAVFTGRVSHELKTPIALIRGYAEALRDRVRKDTKRDYYENVIIEESLRMETLLGDLLDLSRLESGSYILSLQSFSVKDLIIDSLNAFQSEISRKNVVVKLKNLEEDIFVYADKNRIHQVLRNITTNALKAIPENGDLVINVFPQQDNSCVNIEIENSGEGIPPEHISQIWEQFITSGSGSARETGGIGLGLTIVRSILLLHNSKFGVRNTENGVCFYFSLNILEKN